MTGPIVNDLEYRIIEARRQDLARLAAIEVAAAQLFFGQPVEVSLIETTRADLLEEAWRCGRLWVALAGEVPVGFALVALLQPGEAHLEELDVDPAHGRRGIGRRLVGRVCAWAASTGLHAVTLTTFRDVPWNMPFYQRLGFEVIPADQLEPALLGIVREEARRGLDPGERVVMRRSLGPGTSRGRELRQD